MFSSGVIVVTTWSCELSIFQAFLYVFLGFLDTFTFTRELSRNTWRPAAMLCFGAVLEWCYRARRQLCCRARCTRCWHTRFGGLDCFYHRGSLYEHQFWSGATVHAGIGATEHAAKDVGIHVSDDLIVPLSNGNVIQQ